MGVGVCVSVQLSHLKCLLQVEQYQKHRSYHARKENSEQHLIIIKHASCYFEKSVSVWCKTSVKKKTSELINSVIRMWVYVVKTRSIMLVVLYIIT